ncbi:MAG: class I SAM-dependent methyltransferase [Bacteroidales bacterium]|nr:class I SAM-dependent methyltransferase [Bacteroidales bacterium]
MTRECIDFVLTHANEDTARLLLSASRYPSIDMPAAVQQIEGRRTAREKWPGLLECEEFVYPPRLNREQASSEETATHKAYVADGLCGEEAFVSVADLTGGMGIDSIAFARRSRFVNPLRTQVLSHVDYVERSASLCALMEHNSKVLDLENIAVHCADSLEWLASTDQHYDIIYIDPARRAASGRKVAAFEDCEPNILQHMEMLRRRCRWLLVKASPMIDISLAERQLGDVAEVHVVSVQGECKEVIFVCGAHKGETEVHCVIRGRKEGSFYDCDFTRSEEAEAVPQLCSAIGRYLYEPDAALMKGGPYNLICQWMGVEKLARNTHLYTSDRHIADFYGRTWEVLHEVRLNRKDIAEAVPDGKAHVMVRNFPVAAAELQKQLGLKEGGDLFVVATTLGRRRTAFLCQAV